MIFGHEDRSADAKIPPRVVNGKKFWPSMQIARMHPEREGGQRVLRWFRSDDCFVSWYY